MPVGLLAYQACLMAAVVSLLAVLVSAGWETGRAWSVAGLGIIAAIAERSRVRIGKTLEASISLVPTVFAAAVFGPLGALIVGIASFVLDVPWLQGSARRAAGRAVGAPWLKWGVYTCIRGLSGVGAGLAAAAIHRTAYGSTSQVVLATLAAATVAESLDVGSLALTLPLRGRSPVPAIKMMTPIALISAALYVPLVALLATAYEHISPWTLALFFVPAVGAQRLYALYQRQRELAEGLAALNATLEQANLSFASALVATLDARDRYTAGHSAAVAVYARDIAVQMGLSDQEQKLAHLCGLVHDIGKIGLPVGLLEKPGALTLDERREMQRHSTIGERILENVASYTEIAAVVRHHHERLDGHGYPDGISGGEIPLLARIIAVADAYNAMTSDRAYRDAMPTRVARLRLAQAADSQFDADVVTAFEAILAVSSEDYATASSGEFLWLLDRRDKPHAVGSLLNRIAN